LEILREGAEDYEYLWMLRDAMGKKRVPAALRVKAQKLLDLSDLIQDVTRYEVAPARYLSRRRAIAEMLEACAVSNAARRPGMP